MGDIPTQLEIALRAAATAKPYERRNATLTDLPETIVPYLISSGLPGFERLVGEVKYWEVVMGTSTVTSEEDVASGQHHHDFQNVTREVQSTRWVRNDEHLEQALRILKNNAPELYAEIRKTANFQRRYERTVGKR